MSSIQLKYAIKKKKLGDIPLFVYSAIFILTGVYIAHFTHTAKKQKAVGRACALQVWSTFSPYFLVTCVHSTLFIWILSKDRQIRQAFCKQK